MLDQQKSFVFKILIDLIHTLPPTFQIITYLQGLQIHITHFILFFCQLCPDAVKAAKVLEKVAPNVIRSWVQRLGIKWEGTTIYSDWLTRRMSELERNWWISGVVKLYWEFYEYAERKELSTAAGNCIEGTSMYSDWLIEGQLNWREAGGYWGWWSYIMSRTEFGNFMNVRRRKELSTALRNWIEGTSMYSDWLIEGQLNWRETGGYWGLEVILWVGRNFMNLRRRKELSTALRN